jgi:hypothetical protein
MGVIMRNLGSGLTFTRRRLALVVGLAASCTAICAGLAFAEEAHRSAVIVRTTSQHFLASTEGTPVTVTRVTLGKGTWLVQSQDDAVGLNQKFAVVRCKVEAPGLESSPASATDVGNADSEPIVAGDVNNVSLTVTSSTEVTNTCTWDAAGRNTGSYYIDPGATITALPEKKIATVEVP